MIENSTDPFRQRTAALGAALDAAGEHLDPGAVQQAQAAVDKAMQRMALAGEHTVIALAGATGSGKSSLLNCLVGKDIAEVGARRPTTSRPAAAVWGADPADALLDWLGVEQCHQISGDSERDGLVLLDLPDFDSRDLTHREEAERLLELVDMFVWVTDPQKYADAVLHHEFIAATRHHEAVTLVVLNQTDKLPTPAVSQCADDLTRVLAQDGLTQVDVVTASATTGAGIAPLRARVTEIVNAKYASRARLTADLRASAEVLRHGVAGSEAVTAVERSEDELVEALGRAAGIPVILDAVARDYQSEARAHTAWIFSRWSRRLRPDRLRRMRLDGKAPISEQDVRAVLGRSSLPPPSPAARAAVSRATTAFADSAAQGLPQRWADAVHDTAASPRDDLAVHLDRAVAATPLRTDKPWWWQLLNALQWQLGVVTLAGLVWTLVYLVTRLTGGAGEIWHWGPVPVPCALFAIGVAGGLLLAALATPLARAGARQRRAAIERRLRDAVTPVVRQQIIEPVLALLVRHRTAREKLDEVCAR